jgi:hypothetical protein
MAVLAIKMLLNDSELGGDADGEISQNRMSRKLWVENAQRTAFGAADGLGETVFLGIPVQQKLFSAFELVGWDIEVHTTFVFVDEPKRTQPSFLMSFSSKA